MVTLCPVNATIYQEIVDELKKRRDTATLVETVISDIYADGILAKMIRVVIELSYSRGVTDGSKARH